MISRCVTNVRPLLESGTMGTKGHVQVSGWSSGCGLGTRTAGHSSRAHGVILQPAGPA